MIVMRLSLRPWAITRPLRLNQPARTTLHYAKRQRSGGPKLGTKRTRLKWPARTKARRYSQKNKKNEYWAHQPAPPPHHFGSAPSGEISHYEHDACPSRHKSPEAAQACARRRQSAPSRILAVVLVPKKGKK